MKDVFLFPHRFKVVGWLFLIPSMIWGLLLLFDEEMYKLELYWKIPWLDDGGSFIGKRNNLTNEMVMLVVLISALFVAFSKTKEEDEYVQKIRHDSLLWSLYVNYILLAIGIVGVYDFAFINVLVVNMYTPLIIFIVRFQYYYSKR